MRKYWKSCFPTPASKLFNGNMEKYFITLWALISLFFIIIMKSIYSEQNVREK